MATRIPLPGNMADSLMQGINTGGSLYTRAMQPILDREHQQQAEEHFKQQIALKKAAMARAGANSDIQRAIMEQRLLGLKNSNDPQYKMKQFAALQNLITGGGASQQTPSMPTKEMGQGMGMFTPEGMKDVQSQAPATQPGGFDIDAMRKNPMLRAGFKQVFGVDPLGGERENVLHGPARDSADLEKLKKQFGEESEVYKRAENSYMDAKQNRQDLRDLRARTKAGLKVGEKEFFDPQSGEPLGKEIPLTAKERESEEGNIFFNETYPHVYKGAAPFSGEGSITRLQQAAANYKTDPQARKLLDDFLLSEKLLAATTVNEASTLKAGKTNNTYKLLKESLDAQDIPKTIKKIIKEYGVPSSAQLRAGMRYQKILSDARAKARKSTPASQKLFYNPEMQAQYDSQKENMGSPVSDIVIVIDPSGKSFETTEANAAHLPAGWKRG